MNTNNQQPSQPPNRQRNINYTNNQRSNTENNTGIQQQGSTEQRINEIFKELERLQSEQANLLQELRDLTDPTDPPGIDWTYPDPNPETQHSR